MITINYRQLDWLDKHGGRTEKDLFIDDRGLFVYMWGKGILGRTLKKIYLPKKLETIKYQ